MKFRFVKSSNTEDTCQACGLTEAQHPETHLINPDVGPHAFITTQHSHELKKNCWLHDEAGFGDAFGRSALGEEFPDRINVISPSRGNRWFKSQTVETEARPDKKVKELCKIHGRECRGKINPDAREFKLPDPECAPGAPVMKKNDDGSLEQVAVGMGDGRVKPLPGQFRTCSTCGGSGTRTINDKSGTREGPCLSCKGSKVQDTDVDGYYPCENCVHSDDEGVRVSTGELFSTPDNTHKPCGGRGWRERLSIGRGTRYKKNTTGFGTPVFSISCPHHDVIYKSLPNPDCPVCKGTGEHQGKECLCRATHTGLGANGSALPEGLRGHIPLAWMARFAGSPTRFVDTSLSPNATHAEGIGADLNDPATRRFLTPIQRLKDMNKWPRTDRALPVKYVKDPTSGSLPGNPSARPEVGPLFPGRSVKVGYLTPGFDWQHPDVQGAMSGASSNQKPGRWTLGHSLTSLRRLINSRGSLPLEVPGPNPYGEDGTRTKISRTLRRVFNRRFAMQPPTDEEDPFATPSPYGTSTQSVGDKKIIKPLGEEVTEVNGPIRTLKPDTPEYQDRLDSINERERAMRLMGVPPTRQKSDVDRQNAVDTVGDFRKLVDDRTNEVKHQSPCECVQTQSCHCTKGGTLSPRRGCGSCVGTGNKLVSNPQSDCALCHGLGYTPEAGNSYLGGDAITTRNTQRNIHEEVCQPGGFTDSMHPLPGCVDQCPKKKWWDQARKALMGRGENQQDVPGLSKPRGRDRGRRILRSFTHPKSWQTGPERVDGSFRPLPEALEMHSNHDSSDGHMCTPGHFGRIFSEGNPHPYISTGNSTLGMVLGNDACEHCQGQEGGCEHCHYTGDSQSGMIRVLQAYIPSRDREDPTRTDQLDPFSRAITDTSFGGPRRQPNPDTVRPSDNWHYNIVSMHHSHFAHINNAILPSLLNFGERKVVDRAGNFEGSHFGKDYDPNKEVSGREHMIADNPFAEHHLRELAVTGGQNGDDEIKSSVTRLLNQADEASRGTAPTVAPRTPRRPKKDKTVKTVKSDMSPDDVVGHIEGHLGRGLEPHEQFEVASRLFQGHKPQHIINDFKSRNAQSPTTGTTAKRKFNSRV